MKRLESWTRVSGYKIGSHEHTVMVCGVLEIASENQKVDSKVIFCLVPIPSYQVDMGYKRQIGM